MIDIGYIAAGKKKWIGNYERLVLFPDSFHPLWGREE